LFSDLLANKALSFFSAYPTLNDALAASDQLAVAERAGLELTATRRRLAGRALVSSSCAAEARAGVARHCACDRPLSQCKRNISVGSLAPFGARGPTGHVYQVLTAVTDGGSLSEEGPLASARAVYVAPPGRLARGAEQVYSIVSTSMSLLALS
jgi:hypothetical protein